MIVSLPCDAEPAGGCERLAEAAKLRARPTLRTGRRPHLERPLVRHGDIPEPSDESRAGVSMGHTRSASGDTPPGHGTLKGPDDESHLDVESPGGDLRPRRRRSGGRRRGECDNEHERRQHCRPSRCRVPRVMAAPFVLGPYGPSRPGAVRGCRRVRGWRAFRAGTRTSRSPGRSTAPCKMRPAPAVSRVRPWSARAGRSRDRRRRRSGHSPETWRCAVDADAFDRAPVEHRRAFAVSSAVVDRLPEVPDGSGSRDGPLGQSGLVASVFGGTNPSVGFREVVSPPISIVVPALQISVCLTLSERQLCGGVRSTHISSGGCVTLHSTMSIVITNFICSTVPARGVTAACTCSRKPGGVFHGLLTKSAAAAAPATVAKASVVRPGRLLTARSTRAPRPFERAVA